MYSMGKMRVLIRVPACLLAEVAHCAVETAYATCVALSCICALVSDTWIELHNDKM